MTTTNTFTLQDALKVQGQQLEDWKEVLNEKTYLALVAEAQNRNKITKDAYKVFRGTEIDQFVHNIMCAARNSGLKKSIVH